MEGHGPGLWTTSVTTTSPTGRLASAHAGSKDGAADQRAVKLLQHAHHVGVAVYRALRQVLVHVHRLAPVRRQDLVVDLPLQQRLLRHLAPTERGQALDRGQDPLPSRGAPSILVSPSSDRNGRTVL